jgi:hypothetical protein
MKSACLISFLAVGMLGCSSPRHCWMSAPNSSGSQPNNWDRSVRRRGRGGEQNVTAKFIGRFNTAGVPIVELGSSSEVRIASKSQLNAEAVQEVESNLRWIP